MLGSAALVVFGTFVVAPLLAGPLARRAEQALGRAVRVASVSVTLFPVPAVRLKGIEIADDANFGDTPFVTLDAADVQVRLAELLHRELVLDAITLRKPHVRIVESADGHMNVDTLGAPPAGRAPTPPSSAGAAAALLMGTRVQVEDGVLSFISQSADDNATEYDIEDLTLTVTAGPPVTFAGTGHLQP